MRFTTKLLFGLYSCLALTACQRTIAPRGENTIAASKPNASSRDGDAASNIEAANPYGAPRLLGRFEDANVTESSGICASKQTANLYWTHNDSGDGAFLYAFDSHGERGGVWRVANASARDWEDIAAARGADGRSFLYIGDIGDNSRARSEIVVYRVLEPQVTQEDVASTKDRPRMTEPAAAFRLRYPDGKHDAETLMVHPQTGDIYIVTKTKSEAAAVYKLPAPLLRDGRRVSTLVRVGEVRLPSILGGMITGGDISPDGARVVLCDYFAAYEIVLRGNSAESFDQIWQQPLTPIAPGGRDQGEAICYSADGKSLITTSEGARAPLYAVTLKN
ncbi:MAG: hypothetical protein H0V88_04640 [Pyrinomonadaceae bacterium]|nr:hypothetical protein [Pyrinomonadaceae bacterium]